MHIPSLALASSLIASLSAGILQQLQPPLPSRNTTAAAPAPRTGMLLVANQQSASATIIDLATGTTTDLPVGNGPHEAAIAPDGRLGVVTIYGNGPAPGNQLAVIDMSRRSIARMIDLGEYRRPHDVVFAPGSSTRVLVTSEASQRVVVADISTGTVEGTIETRAPASHMLALATDGRTLFTANVSAGGVSQLDASSRTFLRTIPVAPATEGIAITPDGREVWVGSNQAGTVSIVTTQSGTVSATIPNLGMPYRIAISSDGKHSLIADAPGNRVHVIDVATRAVLGAIDPVGSPRGVDIAPDNRTAFITLGPEGEVVVADLVTRTVLGRHKVGTAPDGVGWGIAVPRG
jgi:YVTN family beta-propeller protein